MQFTLATPTKKKFYVSSHMHTNRHVAYTYNQVQDYRNPYCSFGSPLSLGVVEPMAFSAVMIKLPSTYATEDDLEFKKLNVMKGYAKSCWQTLNIENLNIVP